MSDKDKEGIGAPNVICRGGKAGQGDLFPRTVYNATDHPVKVQNVKEFDKLCEQQGLDHGLRHRVGRVKKRSDHPHVRRFKVDKKTGEVVEI